MYLMMKTGKASIMLSMWHLNWEHANLEANYKPENTLNTIVKWITIESQWQTIFSQQTRYFVGWNVTKQDFTDSDVQLSRNQ